jgi:hypothetical protein
MAPARGFHHDLNALARDIPKISSVVILSAAILKLWANAMMRLDISCSSCSRLTNWGTRVVKLLMQSLACQLSLINILKYNPLKTTEKNPRGSQSVKTCTILQQRIILELEPLKSLCLRLNSILLRKSKLPEFPTKLVRFIFSLESVPVVSFLLKFIPSIFLVYALVGG